jgi:ubiquinone/menaquinone biosynthesis C-methylase UbiE
MSTQLSPDVEISMNQWNKNYLEWIKGDISEYLFEYRQDYLDDILRPINKLWKIRPESIYCEIGCGPAIVGLEMAKRGCHTVGIDLSLEALELAQKLYSQENVEGFFVCGDILKMPFKEESLDFIYGGGVIEHFNDTTRVINGLYRVLKKRGSIFLTVPYASLSALTYRQLYGNIPELPVLKEALEFLHTKVLGRRFMAFGYEKSFTIGKLKSVFSRAGFTDIKIDFFECHLPFYRFQNKKIKKFLRKLATLKIFWPMVYIEAEKEKQ